MSELVLTETTEGIRTLTLNNPKRLNGWTRPMLEGLIAAMDEAAEDDAVKVVILTGTDPYYCAGVNLSGALKLDHPKRLHAMIVEQNQALFEHFLRFPKPLIAAINGPAIGAATTTATLCDAIVASDKATFSTPFAKLNVAAEGCSSVLFPHRFGEEAADRILGAEGWKPTGEEAAELGLATRCVPHDELLDAARALAREWIEAGRQRTLPAGFSLEALLEINARESVAVADSFLERPFLRQQYTFLKSRKKTGPAAMFYMLHLTQPLWSRLR